MSTPLRDLLHDLLFEPPARAAFSADPASYLGEHGWDDLRGQDVEAALDALTDELPPEQAALLTPLTNGEGGFDDGLAGAIAGLEAAVSAVDGELPSLLAEPSDPSTTLDDVDEPGGDASETELDGVPSLLGDDTDPNELDDLPFGSSDTPRGADDRVGEDDEQAPDDDDAVVAGVDLGEHPFDAAPATEALWSDEGDDEAIEPDEPHDDVID